MVGISAALLLGLMQCMLPVEANPSNVTALQNESSPILEYDNNPGCFFNSPVGWSDNCCTKVQNRMTVLWIETTTNSAGSMTGTLSNPSGQKYIDMHVSGWNRIESFTDGIADMTISLERGFWAGINHINMCNGCGSGQCNDWVNLSSNEIGYCVDRKAQWHTWDYERNAFWMSQDRVNGNIRRLSMYRDILHCRNDDRDCKCNNLDIELWYGGYGRH